MKLRFPVRSSTHCTSSTGTHSRLTCHTSCTQVEESDQSVNSDVSIVPTCAAFAARNNNQPKQVKWNIINTLMIQAAEPTLDSALPPATPLLVRHAVHSRNPTSSRPW